MLASSQHPIVTLLGPGGIGKTRLAFHIAGQLSARFPDGCLVVGCASVNSADLIIPAIAEAVGLSTLGGVEPIDQLMGYLREKHLLLVVDNFDHLVESAHLLDMLVHAAPHLRMLVTSRERLGLAAEQLFAINGLPTTSATKSAPDALSDAAQLLLNTARQVGLTGDLSDENRSDIDRICQLVEGMPLALELAASWVRVMSFQEIAAEISHNLDILADRRRDLPDRHLSMHAALDYSWDRLSEEEQHVFKQLSVFRGPFSREAAAEVTGASMAVLASLVDKSLLRYHVVTGFDLHELVRQYAAGKLAGNAHERDALEERHSAYFAAWVAVQEEILRRGDDISVLLAINKSLRNIQAGWEYAVSRAQSTLIAQYAFCLSYSYSMRGAWHIGLNAFGSARDKLVGQIHTADRDFALALTLLHHAIFAQQFLDFDSAENDLHEAVGLLRATEAPPGGDTGLALMFLSMVIGKNGDYETCLSTAEQGLVILRPLRETEVLSLVVGLSNLAGNALANNDLQTAQSYLEEGLPLVHSTRLRGWGLFHIAELGRTYLSLGQPDRARACLLSSDFWRDQEPALIASVYWVFMVVAAVLATDGQPVDAAEVFGALMALPLAEARLLPIAPIAESMLADLKGKLSVQVFDAALARGKRAIAIHMGDDHGLCTLDSMFAARITAMLDPTQTIPESTILTDRETQLLRHLEQGLTNKEIAAQMGISPGTVKLHIHHVLEKLGAGNRTQAVARGREFGLID